MTAPVSSSVHALPPAAASVPASGRVPDWKPWFIPAAALTLAADQVSKWWVFSLPATTVFPDWIYRAENTGTAWSLFRDHPEAVTVLTMLLIPGLTWLWWTYYRQVGGLTNLAFGLILGGALGNAWDRVAARLALGGHGVRDFIHVDLGFWPAHPWPDFNLADSGITIGFITLVALSFRSTPPTTAAPARP
jgi:signal peptidase II